MENSFDLCTVEIQTPNKNNQKLQNMSISKGTPVMFSLRDGSTQKGIFSHITPAGLAYIKIPNSKIFYERKLEKISIIGEAESSFEIHESASPVPVSSAYKSAKAAPKVFNVNQKFDFLSSVVRMVIKRQRVSLLITGEGGLGKTHTVITEMEKKGLVKDIDYCVIKGYSTARGLYNSLYDNNGKIVIYDDCDEVLKNDIAKNILKGAIDSYDERTVNWMSKTSDSDEYPNSFQFDGCVIFISNLNQERIDQAIRSRATTIDITMSLQDKFDRMRYVLPFLKTAVPMEQKSEALELLEKNKEFTANINLRTLQEIIDIRTSGEENWMEIAEYIMYNTK